MHDFYSTDAFEEAFVYHGSNLGAIWTKDRTIFRVWAPTAQSVHLNLYCSGTPDMDDRIAVIPMTYDFRGTWVTDQSGDLNGVYYTYSVTIGGKTTECCDPYARATGVNGHRAMVINLSDTNPDGWESDRDPNAGKKITDAIIYELHIRDLSMDRSSGIHHKGKYLGVAEAGTRYKGHSTGLDYMKELGITHLHLLPVYDFGFTDESLTHPQFNWGYDPENFNVPEGSYSTNAFDGAVRIREMKQMIKALHDNGISVIMDVVYNHVYHTDEFCFNQIVPGYFSRIHADGTVSNGSCCGNDTASERAMVRKYIVDSVNYWADEYHIDGFRFDLVGLIDTKTINEIIHTVHRKHPNVLLYGEGWDMSTEPTKPGFSMTIQANSHLVPGFAFFSDTIRDLLRGSIFDSSLPGYVSGAICSKDQLRECFMGIPQWSGSPAQSVNYVSCHDNNTLFDRIALSTPNASFEERVRMNNLAASFVFLSQGVPFIQAGEEILRTKPARTGKFDDNSYRSSDAVNAIKWKTLSKEEYRNNLAYYKGLISFRKAHAALRMTTKEEVQQAIQLLPHDNIHVLPFLIEGEQERIFAVFNADKEAVDVTLPEGNWNVCINGSSCGTETLAQIEKTVHIEAISSFVATQPIQKPVEVVAALIWEKDKFLICQRPANKARAMLWEFVGGKQERGETMEQALIRECREELNITVDVGSTFMQVIHEYPDILIRLTLFHCTIPVGFPEALEHNDIRWIHPSEIDQYAFCPADTDILKEIKRIYGSKPPL